MELKNRWRDLFISLRMAFDLKKVFIQTVGVILAFLVFRLFMLINILIGEEKELPEGIWNWIVWWTKPYLVPLRDTIAGYGISGKIVLSIGIAISLLILIISFAMVARMTMIQVKEDREMGMGEVLKWIKGKIKAVVLSPITIALMIIGFGLVLTIGGLIARIPYFGEIFGVLFTIPAFLTGLLLLFFAYVLAFGIPMLPGVIGAEDGDTFDSIADMFLIATGQWWRMILYEITLVVMAFVLYNVLAYIAGLSMWAAGFAIWTGMGDKLTELGAKAVTFLPPEFKRAIEDITILPEPGQLSITMKIAALIMGGFLVLMAWSVIGYVLAVFSSGNAIAYWVLSNKDRAKFEAATRPPQVATQVQTAPASKGEEKEGGGEAREEGS